MTDNSGASENNNSFRSALHDEHVSLGAEMRNVGGYEVPFRYSSEIAEHNAVREAVGVFDLSLMGIIRVTGEDAASFLAHTLISAIKPLALGRAKYTMIVQEDGGIIDDLIIYRLGSHEFMLVQNAAAVEDVYSTLLERIGGYNVEVERMNDKNALLAIQGPKAAKLLRRLLPQDLHATLDGLNYYSCTLLEVAGVEMIVARTGYTGEDGFEIFPPANRAVDVWRAIIAAGGKVENPEDPADDGADLGLLPCGLACRDTLRLEAGMPLYGYELTRDRTPLEAGLQSIMGPTKGHFIGRNALVNRPQSKDLLVGLRFSGDEAPTRGTKLIDAEGNEVGVLTSTKVSPTLGQPIGFAYVQRWQSATGTEFTVEGTDITATVVPTPFYNRRHRK
ncbi:glycine cleavage system aminomethyltransferase GcvT [uncultured Corynebacterium sp.]|uniref:glycine cleavage system aminomethyltransferase GcvT n=1 Tax=uncultured Corynebacterium sp. TaxID=159447 RepID=UPI00262847EB|nr:glycine cleavage system aminomethyltransferase GcvT [uncultured Corynebacterium sp.]